MTPTEKIAHFISAYSLEEMPPEAGNRAKTAIMDWAGVTLLGSSQESVRIVERLVKTLGESPQTTLLGTKSKTSVPFAALVNGTASHALDYDDTNPVIMSHPSVQLLPGLLALGEYEHRSGKEILLAYVLGFEVGAKIGRAINPNLVYQGWFPVGVLGTYMQAAACAKLLRLDADQTRMALGLSTNVASGLRSNNGTMAKHLMAGQVGSNGVLAALLAREGMTANAKALEDRFGLFENFSRGDLSALGKSIESLGKPLDILESGISYKLYPCCAGSHTAIDCALDIVKKHPVKPEQIEEIQVSLNSRVKFLLIHPRPKTPNEAQFSLEYCVARAILDGKIQWEQFSPEKIQEPALASLVQKVKPSYYEAPALKSGKGAILSPTEMVIKMKDGATLSARVERAKGTASNPISLAELEDKFRQCCRGRLSAARVEQALEQFRNFEKLKDMAELMETLSP